VCPGGAEPGFDGATVASGSNYKQVPAISANQISLLITSLIGLARNPSLLAHLDVGGRKAHRQEMKICDIGHQGDH
jgi:hypothetical protein